MTGVYNGRLRLGTIREHDNSEWEALDLTDRPLGRFKTAREAMAVLPDRPLDPPAIASRPARGRFHGLDGHG